jgi:hypothetical protein
MYICGNDGPVSVPVGALETTPTISSHGGVGSLGFAGAADRGVLAGEVHRGECFVHDHDGLAAIDVALRDRATAYQADTCSFEVPAGNGAEPRELPAQLLRVVELVLDDQAVAEIGAAQRQGARGRG